MTNPAPRRSREDTTTRILDAAEELYSRRDPAKVTMREIAQKAGVTHPLVHQYVGTKADILAAVIQRGAPQRRAIMAAHPDFRQSVPLVMADILERRIHSKSVLRAAMDDTEYADLEDRARTTGMFLGLAHEARQKGTTRNLGLTAMDPGVVLAAMTALAYGWAAAEETLRQAYRLEQDPEDLRQQVVEICEYLAELVFSPATEPSSDA